MDFCGFRHGLQAQTVWSQIFSLPSQSAAAGGQSTLGWKELVLFSEKAHQGQLWSHCQQLADRIRHCRHRPAQKQSSTGPSPQLVPTHWGQSYLRDDRLEFTNCSAHWYLLELLPFTRGGLHTQEEGLDQGLQQVTLPSWWAWFWQAVGHAVSNRDCFPVLHCARCIHQGLYLHPSSSQP